MLCDLTYDNATFIIHTQAARTIIFDNDIVQPRTAIPLLYTANMTILRQEVESRAFAKELVRNLIKEVEANVRREVIPEANRRGVQIMKVEWESFDSCPVRLSESRNNDADGNKVVIVFANSLLTWRD